MRATGAQACEATGLAAALSTSEIFVLLASEGVSKSGTLRVFGEFELRRPTVVNPLRSLEVGVDEVIAALVERGMFRRPARGRLACSREGDVVKHVFNLEWDDMVLRGKVDRFATTKLSQIEVIRTTLQTRCEEWRRVSSAYR